MSVFNDTTEQQIVTSWIWINSPTSEPVNSATLHPTQPHKNHFAPLQPLREWLNGIQLNQPETARFLCKLIPAQCPFERDIKLLGKVLFHIPPMCKLNPLYEELVGLRFRALCYLADECGEDITVYC